MSEQPAITYRLATPDDLPALLHMAHAFYREFGAEASGIPYDSDSTALSFLALMEDEVGLVVVAEEADSPGSLVAAAAFSYFRPMINVHFKAAVDAMFWVNPEHRSSGVGQMLLMVSHVGLKKDEVRKVYMKALSNSPPQAAKLYGALGYAPDETAWSRSLED